MLHSARITELLKDFFKADVEFVIEENGKVFRRGQFELVNVREFYFTITLKIGKDARKVDIPYPFSYNREDNGSVIFDYTAASLAQTDKRLYNVLVRSRNQPKHRLWNRKLIIRKVNESN